MEDVRRVDPMQDQIHDGDHIGQALLLLAEEGTGLQGSQLARGQFRWFAVLIIAQIIMGFAEKTSRAAGPVIHGFADAGLADPDHCPNQGPGGVIFAPVAPGIAHVFDFTLIEMGKLVLFLLGTEAELIHQIQCIPQGIAALEFIADLGKDLPDLVLNGVRGSSPLAEAPEGGEEDTIDKVNQVIPGQGRIWISCPVSLFRGRPLRPAVLLLNDKTVFPSLQFARQGPFLLQVIQVFEKEEPGGLLGIVQLRGAAALFPEYIIDIFKGLFKHGCLLVGM